MFFYFDLDKFVVIMRKINKKMKDVQPRYRRFSSYLKERFGAPVRKISLDAGFSCPNRDGKISDQGCFFCQPECYSPNAGKKIPVAEQLQAGIERGKQQGINQFIAYFQAFTNTYAPVSRLKEIYDTVRSFPEIKALSIGTRPDCVDREILKLIAAYTDTYEVWLELGLQSAHNQTLAKINRGHTVEDFIKAVQLTREFPAIKICGHVILGLPGETMEMEAQTARLVATLNLEGIKLHPLHVVRGTRLARDYETDAYHPLELTDYCNRVVHFLERINPDTVVERLTADCGQDWLKAPEWVLSKSKVIQEIERVFRDQDTWQGKKSVS